MNKPVFLAPLIRKRAGKCELVHVESGAVLASRVDTALDSKSRLRGFPGRGPVPEGDALILAPCRIVHTFFRRFPIDAIFVAADGTVIKICRHVRPWRLVGAFRAFAAIEAAAGFVDRSDTTPGDRLTLREAQLPRPARDGAPMRPVPEAVRNAVSDAVRDADSDADPWGFVTAETSSVELSKPVELAGHVASQAQTAPGGRAPEPQSVELSKPVESSRRAASPAPTARGTRAPKPQSVELSKPVESSRRAASQAPTAPGTRAPELPSVELSKPVESSRRVAAQAPTPPSTRASEPQSVELPKPVETSRRVAAQAQTARTVGAGKPPRAESLRSVDLARLLARQTPIVWFEAVAIVQELCAEVVARGPERDLRVPELTEIAITPEGGIELRGDGPAGQAPVPRTARVLLTLLAEAQTLPVQLRLLALQEVSPAPSCPSLREFSTRLELFERPGRSTVVRSVYERFQKLPALEAEVAKDATAPPLPRRLSPAWRKSARVQAGVGLAAVVVVVTTALWLWPRPEGQGAGDRRGPVTRAVSATADTVARTSGSGLNTVARWFGLAATDRPTATAPAEPASVDAGPTSAPSRMTAPRTARPVEPPRAAETTAKGQPPSTDTTVYSPVDTEIVPPEFVRSRLPKDPPPGVRSEDLPEVEVIISATGEVESVKLVTQPVRVLSAMMLSAVKNWRFQPATRDGQPVRYRMRMQLTNQ